MNYFCSSGHERRFSIFLECNSKDAVAGKLCKSMSPLVWTSVSRVGAVGALQELSWLSLFLPPSPRFYSTSFFFPPYALSSPFCFASIIFFTSWCPAPLYPSLLSPAQCAIRWVRLHWDAEQLSESLQLQPVSGLEGQESVFRRQWSLV